MGIPTEGLAWPVPRAPKRPNCANPRLLPRAGECAEALGELISRGRGAVGFTGRAPPGQRALPTLPAYIASALGVPPGASLGTSPEARHC